MKAQEGAMCTLPCQEPTSPAKRAQLWEGDTIPRDEETRAQRG